MWSCGTHGKQKLATRTVRNIDRCALQLHVYSFTSSRRFRKCSCFSRNSSSARARALGDLVAFRGEQLGATAQLFENGLPLRGCTFLRFSRRPRHRPSASGELEVVRTLHHPGTQLFRRERGNDLCHLGPMSPDVTRGANPSARELLDLRPERPARKALCRSIERIEIRLSLLRFQELHEPFEVLSLQHHEFAQCAPRLLEFQARAGKEVSRTRFCAIGRAPRVPTRRALRAADPPGNRRTRGWH